MLEQGEKKANAFIQQLQTLHKQKENKRKTATKVLGLHTFYTYTDGHQATYTSYVHLYLYLRHTNW